MSLLPFFFEPLVIIGLSLFVSVYLYKKNINNKYSLKISYVILLFFGFVATPLGANYLVSIVEVDFLSNECLKEEVNAVVILGGGVTGDPDSINEIWRLKEESYRRTLFGLDVAKKLDNSIIIVSGGYGGEFREADLMAKLIKTLGYQGKVIKDRDSFTTYSSAINVTKMLTELNINKFWLVTSALHMYRAENSFLKQGVEPCLYPVNKKYVSVDFPGSLLPQITALDKSTAFFHEVIGYIWYVLTDKI